MLSKKFVSAIAMTALMLLSSAMILMSPKANASSWLTTTDTDFAPGNFFIGTGFETVLQGTGPAAYVQNKKDMTNWIQKFPGTDTGPRTQFGFANDSAESRFILFGGIDGSSMWRNDTWEYNYAAANWERICNDNTPACAPKKRIGPSMAYDNNSKVVVMYGGLDDQPKLLADTWEYDVLSNVWTNTTPFSSPKSLGSHKMVYDAGAKRIILVGYNQAAGSMETWEYDASANLWTKKTAIGIPSARTGFALGYSYQNQHKKVVLFGGSTPPMGPLLDETWEYTYSSDSWAQVSPADKPAARSGAQMTYNFKLGIEGLVLWGGDSWSTETWHYNYTGAPATATWSQVLTTTAPVPGRKNHGLAYDPGYNALVIYGGEPFSGPKLNDTWFLESGYRLEGRYYTKFLNTFSTLSEWFHIFFNVTTEPNTQVRFQTEANSVCDDKVTPSFLGPGGLPNTYYTTSGEALWVELTPNKCLRWMADLITNDPSVAPKLLDVSIDYNATQALRPKVASYSPSGFSQPLDSPIYINFTKSMDTTNTWISVLPNVTLDSPAWSEGDTKVKFTHISQKFLEGKKYDICVWATDTTGMQLDYTPNAKFCWFFTTLSIPPKITNTVPAANAVDVNLSASVVITFSEPMNTSSCWPWVTIDPLLPPTLAFDGHSWSGGNTILTLTHSVKYAQFTYFKIDVPIGDISRPCQDTSNILLTFGDTALPWYFTTEAINPFITLTDPMSQAAEVAITSPIKATFSRNMNTLAFYYRVQEWDLANGAWKNTSITFSVSWAGRVVTLSHTTSFGNCKPYRVTMWALDTTGNSLINNPNVPNPWKFMTIGPGGACGPFMMHTAPEDKEENVPVDANVVIDWYYSPPETGGMDAASFTFSLKDAYGNELNVGNHFSTNWIGMGPNRVELLHPTYPFAPCQQYIVKVLTARDTSSRPFIPGPAENPFSFTTNSTVCPPIITWAQPANGQLDVPVDLPIKIKFSVPMDTALVVVQIRPTVTGLITAWTEGNSNLTVTHDDFAQCTWYNMTIFGMDMSGTPLGPGPIPNPIMFRSFCIPYGTYITSHYPANLQTGIPLTASIWINFSDPMDTSSLIFSLLPVNLTMSQYWSGGDMTVRLDHAVAYTQATWYTARVVHAHNKSGGNLVGGGAPNPWTFRSYAPPPYIVTTIPADGDTGVLLDAQIKVYFNKQMDQTSVQFSTNPALGYTQSWENAQTVVFSHSSTFAVCTWYNATVTAAKDVSGTPLGPGPVPNPWTFKSDCAFPVRGLKVTRQAPNVRLDWNADPQVQFWNVFHANDRLTPWPWTPIANITTNFYVHPNAISDMQNHFYIVRGFRPGAWSSNSTMGALWHPTLTVNVGRPSALWFALPYNSMYKKAKDISDELTQTKIDAVAKFDPAKQQTVIWYYSHGQWRGKNFDIAAGEGLMIGIVSNFDWAINGTDRSISMIFSFRPQLRTNFYYISLPYTNGLGSASELVTAIEGGIGPGNNLKITAVGKWVYSTQSSRVFGYTPTGWSGDNFNILPGDGIWIEIVSSFSWSPTLITPAVS